MNLNVALFSILGAVKTTQLTQQTLERPYFNILLGILVGNVYGLIMEFTYYVFNFYEYTFVSSFITYICIMAIIYTVVPQIHSMITKGMYEHKCSYLHNVEYIIDLPGIAYFKRYDEKAHAQSIIDEQHEPFDEEEEEEQGQQEEGQEEEEQQEEEQEQFDYEDSEEEVEEDMEDMEDDINENMEELE